MAIAFDASSDRGDDDGSPSTWSHTCTGDNRILIVGTMCQAGNTITGVTYAGAAMTQINTQAIGGATFSNQYLFYKVAPATGANDIVVSSSGGSYIYSAA